MSAVIVKPGDFTGWDRVINLPGETMVWNWPSTLTPADAAFSRCFRAEAIGTKNGDLIIRTPPEIPTEVVEPLVHIIDTEQLKGRAVGLSLMPGRVEDGDDPTLLYATLFASSQWRLNSHFRVMSKRMATRKP